MIKLQVNLMRPGYADGHYMIKAKGFILAVLNWGTLNGNLEDWEAFAYVPIDPAGNGKFSFCGARGIPKEATHVCVRCFSPDFSSHEDAIFAIPKKYLHNSSCLPMPPQRFSVLTDLHLSSKPWRIKQALGAAKSEVILLLGDITNDGSSEQFRLFEECINENVPGKIILPVIGNHDVLHADVHDGCENYAEFQSRMLAAAESKGLSILYHEDSPAYAVRIGSIDIVGLQCVISGRRFSFPEGKQITWLHDHLHTQQQPSRHLILCHAPLLAHNPNRNTGNPYLGKDKMLQEIIDGCENIIFLSGHTHMTPNTLRGNVEIDEVRNNIYINCGSVVGTDITKGKEIMSNNWNDGCVTEIAAAEDEVEICMYSARTGIKFPRGYYRKGKAASMER